MIKKLKALIVAILGPTKCPKVQDGPNTYSDPYEAGAESIVNNIYPPAKPKGGPKC